MPFNSHNLHTTSSSSSQAKDIESSLEPEYPVQPVSIIVFRISAGSIALPSAIETLLADLSALSLPFAMNMKVTHCSRPHSFLMHLITFYDSTTTLSC